MQSLVAVILTGSRDQHNILLAGTGLSSKTLLPVHGKTMLQWVHDALTQTRFQPPIYISTQDPEIHAYDFGRPVTFIESGNKAVASFLGAISQVPDDAEWVLLASGDHVLLTPEMVEHFVSEAQARDLTLAAAAVAKSTVDKHYPASKRTYMPLKNDGYSGGNLYLIHKPRFMAQQHVLEAIDNNRKKPWKSVFMLDPWTVLRVLFRQMTITELVNKASNLIGCKAGVVVMPYAEACMDVDKPSDKTMAEAILEARETSLSAVRSQMQSKQLRSESLKPA